MNKYQTIIFCDFDGTITTEETFVGTLMRLYTYDKAIAIGDMGSTDYQMAKEAI